MQKPDFELRTAIVLIKAQERNIDIDMQAAQSIAEKITDSRELEGALLKLLSLSLTQTDSNKITAESASTQLQKEADSLRTKIRPNDIIRAVATYYDMKPAHIRGSSRKQNIVLARQITMYFLRVKLGLNLDEVAFITKRKDHTTVIHGVDKVQAMLMRDSNFKSQIESIYETLSSY
jgi:chromosomal replication initiator protein